MSGFRYSVNKIHKPDGMNVYSMMKKLL